MGMQSYEELLEENRGHILPFDHPLSQKVDAVLQRLIPVAPLEGANWRVHVIDDINTPNAFVLPGYGKPLGRRVLDPAGLMRKLANGFFTAAKSLYTREFYPIAKMRMGWRRCSATRLPMCWPTTPLSA